MVFEVIVDGRPTPIVKWFREGIQIYPSADYDIRFENNVARLVIIEAFPEDSGAYKCFATNVEGSVTTEALLDVEGKAQVVLELDVFFVSLFLEVGAIINCT